MDELRQMGNWMLVSAWGSRRHWVEFISGFSVPKAAEGWPSLEARLRSNLRQYKNNYITIAGVLSVYSLLTNWYLLLVAIVAGGTYAYLFSQSLPLVIQGRLITARQKLLGWSIASTSLCLVLGCLWTVLWLVFLVALVVLIHGTFRTPSRFGSKGRGGSFFSDHRGSDDEGNVDEEAGGNMDDDDQDGSVRNIGGMGGRRGPVPGTVETRHRKNEEYLARRQRLQNRYPNLNYGN